MESSPIIYLVPCEISDDLGTSAKPHLLLLDLYKAWDGAQHLLLRFVFTVYLMCKVLPAFGDVSRTVEQHRSNLEV